MKTLTVVVPIQRFNEYSRQAMRHLGTLTVNPSIEFLFVVAYDNLAAELRHLLGNFSPKHAITVTHNPSSNYLRSQAKLAITDFVFYHDCDDYANFQAIADELAKDPAPTEVHCFPIYRVPVDTSGNELSRKTECNFPVGPTADIRFVPTYVYSKFIPTAALANAEFPNLPYSQDWAISYSLFAAVPHRQHSTPLYDYINYPSSSSAVKLSRLDTTKRVVAYSRHLVEKFKDNSFAYNFLKFRYLTMLSVRFKQFGLRYFDKSIRLWPLLTHAPFSRFTASLFYQYPQIIFRLIK